MSIHTKAHTFVSHTSQRTDQSLQKSVLFSNPRKLKNKKFPSLLKNKTSQPHSPRQTDTNIHGRHLTAQYLLTHGDTNERTPACNSTLPKVAVSCFVGQFCGYINFGASYENFC